MESSRLTGYPSIDKPWLKNYSEETLLNQLPECTIYEYILDCNRYNMNRIAMNYYGKNITYGQMFQQIDLLAGKLEASGVQVGEVVTVCMINAPETACLLFALNKIGAVANMAYGADSSEELQKHILDTKSKFVFTLDMFQEKIAAIADSVNLKKIVVTNITESMSFINRTGARLIKGMKPLPLPNDKRFCSWKDFFKNKSKSSRTCHDCNSPAVITYTGGTTGGSKGAILSSKAVLAVGWQYIKNERELRKENTWMQILPLFIAYGVTCSLIIPLVVGMKMIIRIPMTETITELCRKFKPNHIIYSPAYWEAFAEEDANLDLSYLIAPISGGDMLRPSIEAKINEYLKKHGCRYPIMNGYGMTEVGAAVCVNYQQSHKLGSVGTPFLKNTIAAFDPETGQELPYNQEGEICINTPSMMSGYANNQEETNNIIRQHEDGCKWVHSGDLGYVDEDGFVFISGRLKRFFAYADNGIHKKIFSLDIERVLLRHPAVENCAVVPIKSQKTLEAPVAYIILKDNDDADSENKVIAYGEEHLSGGYRPVKYYFVDKFPLTKIGKVDYRALEAKANAD